MSSAPGIAYVYLAAAIVAEIVATTALKATEEFTRPVPSIVVVIGYGLAFYLLTLVLRSLPLGIAYALWSGFGMVLIVAAGAVFYRQVPDLAALAGIGLIIAGAVVIHMFSSTTTV